MVMTYEQRRSLDISASRMTSDDAKQHCDEEVLNTLKVAIERCIFYAYPIECVEALGPFIETYRPTITQILSASHSLCDDCDLYSDCDNNDWIESNPELFDSEIAIFRKIFELYSDYIVNDMDNIIGRLKHLYDIIVLKNDDEDV